MLWATKGPSPSRRSQGRPQSPAIRLRSGAFVHTLPPTAVLRVAPGTSPGPEAEAGLGSVLRPGPDRAWPPAPQPGFPRFNSVLQ